MTHGQSGRVPSVVLAFLRNHRESYCRYGFLYRSHHRVWSALLLFRHRPRHEDVAHFAPMCQAAHP